MPAFQTVEGWWAFWFLGVPVGVGFWGMTLYVLWKAFTNKIKWD